METLRRRAIAQRKAPELVAQMREQSFICRGDAKITLCLVSQRSTQTLNTSPAQTRQLNILLRGACVCLVKGGRFNWAHAWRCRCNVDVGINIHKLSMNNRKQRRGQHWKTVSKEGVHTKNRNVRFLELRYDRLSLNDRSYDLSSGLAYLRRWSNLVWKLIANTLNKCSRVCVLKGYSSG